MEAEDAFSVNCRKRCFHAIIDYSALSIAIPKKKIKFDTFIVDLEAITFGLHSLSLDEPNVKCYISRKRRFDAMNDCRTVSIAVPNKKKKFDDFNVDLEAITFGLHSLSLNEPNLKCYISRKRYFAAVNDGRTVSIAVPEK